MVEKVEAFKTSDGKVFMSRVEAAEYQSRVDLRRLLEISDTPSGSDSEWADFLVERASQIHAVLAPLVEALEAPALHMVR